MTYKLPPPDGGLRLNAAQQAAQGTAAEYVWCQDSGEPFSAESAKILRDALALVLAGNDSRDVFGTRRKRGAPSKWVRRLVVAAYVEQQRREYRRAGAHHPLSLAKADAAEAFNWDIEDPESAIQDAWTANVKDIAHYSDAVLATILTPWKSGK